MQEPFYIQTDQYSPLDEDRLADYLAAIPPVADLLGGASTEWRTREVGDGNLNLVFIVEGPGGSVVVKQALPYVRVVGKSWPLTLQRSHFEASALIEQARAAPGLAPRLFAIDRVGAAIVMEHFQPHIILRKALIRGRILPLFAGHMAAFLADSLFKTSDFNLPAARKKALMATFCANVELCKITEDLVFTDPYRINPRNRWTSPQLDDAAAAFRADSDLKAEVQALKLKFMTTAQALIHGDLHTGSIMVTETDTQVIDPEFAFFGPMGFDLGALIANLLIAVIAHPAHAKGSPEPYQDWILDQAEKTWSGFDDRFRRLWSAQTEGDAFTAELFRDDGAQAALGRAQDRYMADLFADMLGFAGCKMIRRTLGMAHVEDLESIADPDLRARHERQVLAVGRELILSRHRMTGFGDIRRTLAERAR